MNCTIRGLSQKMDFTRDTLQTFLLLELPTGEIISALIEEDVAARVIASRVVPPQASNRVQAPSAFPLDTLPPVTIQHVVEDTPSEPDLDEQESDEDGTPSV